MKMSKRGTRKPKGRDCEFCNVHFCLTEPDCDGEVRGDAVFEIDARLAPTASDVETSVGDELWLSSEAMRTRHACQRRRKDHAHIRALRSLLDADQAKRFDAFSVAVIPKQVVKKVCLELSITPHCILSCPSILMTARTGWHSACTRLQASTSSPTTVYYVFIYLPFAFGISCA